MGKREERGGVGGEKSESTVGLNLFRKEHSAFRQACNSWKSCGVGKEKKRGISRKREGVWGDKN